MLIWVGAGLSLVGLMGLSWCIARVWTARRAGLDDAAMRALLARVVPVNLGALLLSVLGLMLVIAGIMLG